MGIPKRGLDLPGSARSGGRGMETEGRWELLKVYWELFYRRPCRDGISQPVWDLECSVVTVCLHNCTEKVRVCMQHNYEVNYTVDVHVRICFGAAAEAREVGAVCTGCIPAPLSSFSSLLQEHKHLFPSEAV